MNMKKTLRAVLLALLCVPASVVGVFLGYIVGFFIAIVLRDILAPGASYEHYSIGTPVGNVAILGPVAIGAALPWIAFGWYILEAQEIVDPFAAGQVVQAHYNSQDPSDAYLIRWTDCGGYLLFMVATLFLIFQYVFFGSHKTRNVRRVATTITLVWYGVAILVWTHYFVMVGSGYSLLALGFACTSATIGLIPAAVAIRSRPSKSGSA